jgi:hypothetical protein
MKKLFILILILILGWIIWVNKSGAAEILVHNCSNEEMIGIAQFNEDMTDFVIHEDKRVMPNGTLLWSLDPGVYCISYYNPNANLLGYELIEIVDDDFKEILNYRCEDRTNGV